MTIAVSVIISAFNALTLSPALFSAPAEAAEKGLGAAAKLYDWFNRFSDAHGRLCKLVARTS